ncbi:uncharacterized protein LOC120354022 [Nilaparvata lugens]|uniref:uncharacterized protein LOC120354022 n=1 Tax=Nilaparvata lugens TaxID=108931 RepID=UPI00193D82B4|nr:uncharacterized protein LOC120354022 [Nilaparvata lugens]
MQLIHPDIRTPTGWLMVVAQEGRTVLPHCSRTRVNLQEVHLSLLLYSFLEAGILDAIVEVIVSDDSFLSVRATILLGELLHLTHLLLPPECCHVTPVMPTLVSYAVRGRRSATSLTQTNFGANRHQAGSNSSAHYERFRRQMQQDEQRRMRRRREAVGGGGGGGGEGKRERRRTVSGQSCRSRTVSDSSGDRSRLDRDSVSASNEPYSAGQSKRPRKQLAYCGIYRMFSKTTQN